MAVVACLNVEEELLPGAYGFGVPRFGEPDQATMAGDKAICEGLRSAAVSLPRSFEGWRPVPDPLKVRFGSPAPPVGDEQQGALANPAR